MGHGRNRYLDYRIVYCANCDDNRTLLTSARGPVCSTCMSTNWTYLARSAAVSMFRKVVEFSSPRLKPVADASEALIRTVVELSSPRLTPVPVKSR